MAEGLRLRGSRAYHVPSFDALLHVDGANIARQPVDQAPNLVTAQGSEPQPLNRKP